MPVQFFDLCSNFIHLVPRNFRQIPPNNVEHVAAYFESAYPFKTYTSDESLTDVLHETVDQILFALPAKPVPTLTQTQHASVFDTQTVSTQLPKKLKSRNFHVEYYQEHKEAGLDYMGHGEWQEVYGKWIVETFDVRDKDILDVGCACGSLATGMQKAGARVHGVDLNNHMIRLGKVKFKDVHLYVCDSVNLHLFGDESFSLVHSNQVAEHWKKELVPFILKEQLRVLRRGGFNFCVMDTEDLFTRQRRNNEDEDPTNACIMPLEWWHSQFLAAGYVPAPEEVVNKLKEHPQSYFNKYDWDWVLYQAPYV
jgi:ubiquinone/menaquinone biosynthesis C-methylase UbiE